MELWFMFLHAATDVAIKNEPDEMYLSRMCGDQVASKRSWCTSLGFWVWTRLARIAMHTLGGGHWPQVL